MKTCAEIVVTYNRKKLLQENIESLLSQTYEDHDIYIIDNASTDGTELVVKDFQDDRIHYVNTGKNLGGAGGFSFGIREALKNDYKYIWIMDDDSVPEKSALASLIEKAAKIDDEFAFLASLVYWTDGQIFPMNVPNCDYKSVIDVNYDMIRRNKLVPVRCGSFVGCFVKTSLIREVGLPITEFFIYGDDAEYTKRLRKTINKAYIDLDSIIVHKAPDNKGADIVNVNPERIGRFFFQWRNGMYIARKEKQVSQRIRLVIKTIISIWINSSDNKIRRSWMVIKGTVVGITFNPIIQYVD